ncbi:hypothetical protein [Nocardiopsis sp. CNT312]|uniref:hypothetical protein n=1 Tax=Nocardiopsis sp. CNT312 TaxID=1137268 RepID=UPI00048AA9B5|nr:hypothetical protein [Nocardiopsis sp. CNT312]
MPDKGTASLHWDYRDGRVAAVAAAVVYSLWVLEMVLPGGETVRAEPGTPVSAFEAFWESAHRMASILVMVAAGLGLSLGARETRRWLLVSWWAMFAFGALSLATSLLPGRCTVSTDVACTVEALVEGAGGPATLQAVLAVAAMAAALLSVVALAVNRWRCGDRMWVPVAVLAGFQAATAVGVLVVSWVFVSSGTGQPGTAMGTAERAHLVALALWLLAAGLLRGPWLRTPRTRRSASPR